MPYLYVHLHLSRQRILNINLKTPITLENVKARKHFSCLYSNVFCLLVFEEQENTTRVIEPKIFITSKFSVNILS